MKTQIFAYKNIVGISAGDKLVNDPCQPGQLGCIVDINEIEISREAYNILRTLKKCRGSLGDVMCWSCTDPDEGEAYFGWLGGFKAMITKETEGDRDFNPSLLKSQIVENLIVPEDFKNAID